MYTHTARFLTEGFQLKEDIALWCVCFCDPCTRHGNKGHRSKTRAETELKEERPMTGGKERQTRERVLRS